MYIIVYVSLILWISGNTLAKFFIIPLKSLSKNVSTKPESLLNFEGWIKGSKGACGHLWEGCPGMMLVGLDMQQSTRDISPSILQRVPCLPIFLAFWVVDVVTVILLLLVSLNRLSLTYAVPCAYNVLHFHFTLIPHQP